MSKANLSFERFYSPSRSHQLAAVKALLSLPVRQEQSEDIASVLYCIGLGRRPIAPLRDANVRPLAIKIKVSPFLWFKMPSVLGGESS